MRALPAPVPGLEYSSVENDFFFRLCMSVLLQPQGQVHYVHNPFGLMSAMFCPNSERKTENLFLLLPNLSVLCIETRVLRDTGPCCQMACLGFPGQVLLASEWLVCSITHSCSLLFQTLTSCPVGCQWGGPQPFSARLVSLRFTGSALP